MQRNRYSEEEPSAPLLNLNSGLMVLLVVLFLFACIPGLAAGFSHMIRSVGLALVGK